MFRTASFKARVTLRGQRSYDLNHLKDFGGKTTHKCSLHRDDLQAHVLDGLCQVLFTFRGQRSYDLFHVCFVNLEPLEGILRNLAQTLTTLRRYAHMLGGPL